MHTSGAGPLPSARVHWWMWSVRAARFAACFGIVAIAHLPAHFASVLKQILGEPPWSDGLPLLQPAFLDTLFWLPVAALTLALTAKNWGRQRS